MLTYVEQIDNELKRAGSDNFGSEQKVKERDHRRGKNQDDDNKQDEELDQIAGGKEAEIEQYSQMLTEITEKFLL